MTKRTVSDILSATGDGVMVRLKVVPGASRTKLAGVLGDRLKLAIAAPPEGGKANQAACALLAEVFGVPARDVRIASGLTRPTKTAEVLGLKLCSAVDRLNRALR